MNQQFNVTLQGNARQSERQYVNARNRIWNVTLQGNAPGEGAALSYSRCNTYHFKFLRQLRSLEVGTEFPTITNLRLQSGELEEDGARLRALDLKFDLAYDGNFRIDVDAVMLLGKIANISITGKNSCEKLRPDFGVKYD